LDVLELDVGSYSPDGKLFAVASSLGYARVWDATTWQPVATLRGLSDVRVPTLIALCSYWVVAIPLCYVLGFHTSLGPVGIWWGLAAGLGCAAGLLVWRIARKTRVRRT
jgi:MATE family multidrug resistance protein